MRIAIVSFRKKLLVPPLKSLGHKIVRHSPDVVIAWGGDGTFLWAEKEYPNIPKIFIYKDYPVESVLKKLDGIKFMESTKIQGTVGKKTVSALNDINIHYMPPRALRFDVAVNGKTVAKDMIGDGVVVSTPFGSSAYFKSITGKKFKKGIGIAFNNTTKRKKSIIVNEDSIIEIMINRENGVLACDTNPKCIPIKKKDKIIIKKTDPVKVALFKGGKK